MSDRDNAARYVFSNSFAERALIKIRVRRQHSPSSTIIVSVGKLPSFSANFHSRFEIVRRDQQTDMFLASK